MSKQYNFAEKVNRKYTCKILTKPEDMYVTHNLALLLNPNISKDDYITTVNNACAESNYRQAVIFKGEKPVSFIAIQSVVLMKCAPKKSLNLSNVATLPEERGAVTQLLFSVVKQWALENGYANIDIRSSKTNRAAAACYTKNGFRNEESHAWRMKIENENERGKAKL